MAPRLGGQAVRTCLESTHSLPSCLSSSSSSSHSLLGVLSHQPWRVTPSPVHQGQPSRAFSATPASQRNIERRRMRAWMSGPGARFRSADAPADRRGGGSDAGGGGGGGGGSGSGPNYMGNGNQPFPQNPFFRSQPVLSEQARELIWERIMVKGESVKAVSAEMGVDMRRIAAVVRLKEVEKDWISKGKTLAKPYAKAVLAMLPQTTYGQGNDRPHEPINEVHVHGYTMQQLFLPTSESRVFTRAEAAKAFHERMLPADARVPHPELIQMEREVLRGADPQETFDQFRSVAEESERQIAAREARRQQRERDATVAVDSDRFEFRFRDVSVDDVGRDGRSRKGTGWRYGVPFYDRKRGEVKIPTKVE